jgi:hypothetical protein
MKTTTEFVNRVDDLIWRRIGDEVVIITEDGLSTHVLNKTAAFIWEQCDGQASISDITARLCDNFEVSNDEAAADAREIIDKWLNIGIVRPAGETA